MNDLLLKPGRTAVALLLAAVLGLPAGAVGADPDSVVHADAPLLEARSPEERTCLAEASRVDVMITIWVGRRAQDTSYAADLERIVEHCRAGRYDQAMDLRAVIWAAVTLHQPHKS